MSVARKGSIPQLDRRSEEPYYRQIYDRIRSAIAAGSLKPGDRIPSARALIDELGLARGTIDAAYSLLQAEGYIESRGQAGTIVAPGLIRPQVASPVPRSKTFVPTLSFRPETILPFQMGLPALDLFPRKIWARLGARCARAMQPADMAHPSVYGLPDLRAEIAAYLQVARGVNCAPAQVFITSGYRHTVQMIVRALLNAGDRVWVEDPGYPPTRELLKRMGMSVVSVPVDQEGMVTDLGVKAAPRARAAVVTPAHQSPLGVSLALPRRMALLDWAAKNKAWILEDDYDGEYRYVGRPLPALKSLDREGRVLYSGTFSKVLFPALRLAYLVVPATEVERFEEVNQTWGPGSPQLTQTIVMTFIKEGYFARHIQRMRKLYGERRELATAGLTSVLNKHVSIDLQPGGMHLILRLKAQRSDRLLVARMLEDGLYGEALSDWTDRSDEGPAILVNFTNIGSQRAAEALGRRILKVMA